LFWDLLSRRESKGLQSRTGICQVVQRVDISEGQVKARLLQL
jgi:hypothetical protein